MKKLFLSMLLLALPLLACAYDAEVDGIYYNLNSEEKTAEVTYQSKDLYDNVISVYTGSVDIPDNFTYDGVGYTVTSIGNSAFYNCSSLISVTIPNSVTSVADNAFSGCYGLPVENGVKYADTYLIEVVDKTQSTYPIKDGTRFIAARAFYDCRNLTSVEIPNSVITIGERAFYDCRYLTSVDIGNSVTYIGSHAFSNCYSLTSVIIPNSVTSIGSSAFYSCNGLISVTIGNSVASIEENAFKDCSSLTSVTIGNSVTNIGNYAFYGCSGLTSVTIGNSVENIGRGAFGNCISLSSIVIPNSVTSIFGGRFETGAFNNCSSLTSVVFGNSVTEIGYGTFAGCNNLNSICITDLGAWCKVVFEGDGTAGGDYYGESSNPLCLAHHLYLDGEEIKDLVIPNSVTDINGYAFQNCNSLISLTIPNSVNSIGFRSFDGCSNLTNVTISSSVTSIGDKAFANCHKLEKITCLAESVPNAYGSYSDDDRFSGSFSNWNYQNTTLYVPAKSLSLYKKTSPWCYFKYIYALEDGEPEKCATPTISYANKKLTFSCDTEGVEYHYTITDSDIKSDVSSSVDLSASYEISVYATKSGYYDSDMATATLVWTDAIFTETTEKPTSAKAVQESIPVLISANGGVITVKSEQEGQAVAVYTADGKVLGSANVKDGQAAISTNLQRGEIVIVKVGSRSVKVKMSDF